MIDFRLMTISNFMITRVWCFIFFLFCKLVHEVSANIARLFYIRTPCYSMSSAFSLPYHPQCYTILCDKTWWLKILPVNSFRAIFTTFFPVYFYVFWLSLFYHHYLYRYYNFISWNDMAKILTWYQRDLEELSFWRYNCNFTLW